jgi:hypothetical protein
MSHGLGGWTTLACDVVKPNRRVTISSGVVTMQRIEQHPPGWRLTIAFILAPLVGALALALGYMWLRGSLDDLTQLPGTFGIIAIFGALPTAVVVGLPTLGFYIGRVPMTPANCTTIGAVVAVSPWLFLAVGAALILLKPLAVPGAVILLIPVAVAGAVGGFAFWVVGAAGWKPRPPKGQGAAETAG